MEEPTIIKKQENKPIQSNKPSFEDKPWQAPQYGLKEESKNKQSGNNPDKTKAEPEHMAKADVNANSTGRSL